MPPPADPAPPAARARLLPWRSGPVGWALAALFLAAGLPLYMRMPPWCDITLYEIAARNVIRGGVHYRDVFDTNLPGFVWLLVGIRRAFGPGMEILRAIDLAVVMGIVGFLAWFARRAGAPRAGVAWLVAGAAFFYPFTAEFNHAQRDVWMLLPALAATRLRLLRAEARRTGFWPAAAEGAIWGCAIWIKPHVLIPVAAVWLATVRRLTGAADRPWRTAARDAAGYFAGGGAVGLLGIACLVATGTWKPFVDVFEKWNGAYAKVMWDELPERLWVELSYFPPYSYLLPLPLAVAALNLLDARVWARGPVPRPGPVGRWVTGWLYDPGAGDGVRFTRGVLAALFLAWAAQAAFLQRMFHYVHVPEILLMFAVAAANRWAVAAVGMAYAAACGGVWLAADHDPDLDCWLKRNVPTWTDQWLTVPRHPLAMPDRMGRWPDCFRPGLPDREYRERQEAVALLGGTFASIDPVESREVADYLRSVGAGEGEVLCWHDSPHAVYLELDHRPPFRFMHLSTTLLSTETYDRMKRELIKTLARKHPPVRYVVSDLKRVYLFAPDDVRPRWAEPGPGGDDLLPPQTPANCRAVFPIDQPCVFRSGGGRGRYVVHRMVKPFGPYDNCFIPGWPDEPGK